MTIRSDFSDSFVQQTFGKVTGTFAMSQFPNAPGYLARFKAYSSNSSRNLDWKYAQLWIISISLSTRTRR